MLLQIQGGVRGETQCLVNVVPRLVNPLGGNVVANQVDGILRHDDVFRLHLENFCNGARVFVLALHQ